MDHSDKILNYYHEITGRIDFVRNTIGRPLTLTEKILYANLTDQGIVAGIKRGIDYAEFYPGRVAMQDATAQMALLQFMMAGRETSAVEASVHCDHLITAKNNAAQDLKNALGSNKEVYDFLNSVCSRYNLDFWEPGSGIIHQIVLENYAYPGGLLIGTDSHTPTAGGLGMIAVGVGGADAVDVMAGMGWELKIPRIIGIRLTGKLSGWVSAKDVILKITGMLSVKGGTGSVLEYFGSGAESISATGKATICNMGAETGATCSIFGYDKTMAAFLKATGREHIATAADMIYGYLRGDQEVYENPALYFDNYLQIDLSALEPYINGPFTPDLATPLSNMKEEAEKNNWPVEISAGLIGSCTNSSYEDLSRAASVMKNAIANKCRAKGEFLITPGSEQIRQLAEKAGFFKIFREAGGEVFANACGPCIGQWDRKGAENGKVNSIVHSFNRNFSRRTDGNPNTHSFVASPEIVAALTLAGKLTFNPVTDTIINSDGKPVMLAEPRGINLPPDGFGTVRRSSEKETTGKKKPAIEISPDSERLQELRPFPEWSPGDFFNMSLLIKVKGKCTTDHISMAGKWLRFRGHLENISKNYMIGAINYFNNEAGIVLDRLTGKYESVPTVAGHYKKKNISTVVIGEENFGEGSSREHAAMEPRYLNVKAILVKSFARIHETNLKKQGILTLTFQEKADYDKIREDDRIDIPGLPELVPGKQLNVLLKHSDGSTDKFPVNHSYNTAQLQWFRAGSALNLIRKYKLNKL